MPPLPPSDYAPPSAPITVLHRDADLLIVDKPEGLLSVPGKGPALADCLLTRLQADDPDVRLVHRLDRDTSGVMVFARTAMAQRHLGLQFERKIIRKAYVARVIGDVADAQGRVDLPLRADWENRPLQQVDHAQGRAAQTDWQVLSRAPTGSETRMQLHPLTGRSHQLRVHMRALGHPILGDPLYATGAARPYPRMMLHAETLELRHPTGGAWHRFDAAVPF